MRRAIPLGPLVTLSALSLLTMLAVLTGCGRKVKAEECTRMLDRYLDMTIASDPKLASMAPAQAAVVRDMKRELKKGEKSYRQVQEQCEAEVSRREYDCAMGAPTANDWEACIE